jgi:hypothetical protein
MIKVSHKILEKEFIKLLQNSNLDEEILLFYYYKGNYSKCLNKIISIYDSLEKIEIQKGKKLDKDKNFNKKNKTKLNSNSNNNNIDNNKVSINFTNPKNLNLNKNKNNNNDKGNINDIHDEHFRKFKDLTKTIDFENLESIDINKEINKYKSSYEENNIKINNTNLIDEDINTSMNKDIINININTNTNNRFTNRYKF